MVMMCEAEQPAKRASPESVAETQKKTQGFLASVFSNHGSFNKKNLFNDTSEEKLPVDEKNQSFFSSVIGSNQGLFNDISLKLEAAFSLSIDSDSSSKSEETSRKNSVTDRQSDSSLTDTRRTSLPVTKTEQVSKRHHYTKRKGMKQKDRSVYGQPEIDLSVFEAKSKPRKDISQESLDTVDSGQSLGNSSSHSTYAEFRPDKTDPFYVYRRTESVGIGSESDQCCQSTSLESSDAESIPDAHSLGFTRCGSTNSLHSSMSSPSCESQPDEILLDAVGFMKMFVKKIFSDCMSITFEEKARFGELCQSEIGRLWFARCVNGQRVHSKQVSESTFYGLVMYFAIVLFECFEADDFSPAKSLMNMCFTFYYEINREGRCPAREYLFTFLKNQPIWRSIRFWNAAFFDAVQCERANRQIPTRSDLGRYSPEDFRDEKSFQENIVFGQLGTFTYNMFAFELSKDFCLGFLKKQCTIASLSEEHVSLLWENIDRMYSSGSGNDK